MTKINFENNRAYEWLIISQSYFQCALISARILKEKIGDFGIDEKSPIKRIWGDYSQSPEYLIFPIIFNFKHGIEIYLKSVIGIKNSEFSKNHNSINLSTEASIIDKKAKKILEKYAFSRLFLLNNQKQDIENQFERYPQNNPYDNLELYYHEDNKGKNIKTPNFNNFDDYSKWLKNNNAKVNIIVTEEKIGELISDIEFLYKNIQNMSLSALKNT